MLGFEAAHLEAAISQAGAQPARTFALLELVELLGRVDPVPVTDPIDDALKLITRANELRSSAPGSLASVEIDDPIGRARSRQQAIGHQVSRGDELGRAALPRPPVGPTD